MSEEKKLNSVQALASIYGVEATVIHDAEEKGTLEDLQAKFKNDYQMYNLDEQIAHKKNIVDNYQKGILSDSNSIPQELYNFVKSNAFAKKEKQLKSEFGVEGENIDELISAIVLAKSDQPNESKKEDLDKINDLTKQLSNRQDLAKENLEFKNRIIAYDDLLATELEKNTSKFTSHILQNIIDKEIEKIPFENNESGEYLEFLQKGFKQKFSNDIEIKLNEKLEPEAFDIATGARIENKINGAKKITDVFTDYIKQNKISVKVVKQGADIKSLSQEGGIRNMADAQKYISDNNIVGMDEQMKVFRKIPVKK